VQQVTIKKALQKGMNKMLVAKLFADVGVIASTAYISPYRADRDQARELIPDSFVEVYVKADLEVCESRDPKGLYKKARAGEIPEFTGISAPYEAPESPEASFDTSHVGLEVIVDSLMKLCRSL